MTVDTVVVSVEYIENTRIITVMMMMMMIMMAMIMMLMMLLMMVLMVTNTIVFQHHEHHIEAVSVSMKAKITLQISEKHIVTVYTVWFVRKSYCVFAVFDTTIIIQAAVIIEIAALLATSD